MGHAAVLRCFFSKISSKPKIRLFSTASGSGTVIPVDSSRHLSLIGPPGSGKGSYGRHLADHVGLRVVTVSDVLRSKGVDTSGGSFVDDDIVCDALRDHLEQDPSPALLDGFPRTHAQVQRMDDWPEHTVVRGAIFLNVPSDVCGIKMEGRRFCTKCQTPWNVNEVYEQGYHLPPNVPEQLPCHLSGCDPDMHWTKRPDDRKDIIKARLELHDSHTQPIVEYFRSKGTLLELRPYLGFDDIPRIKQEARDWFEGTFSSNNKQH